MLSKDFYGMKYVWWTGIVENRKDEPLKTGSVRVRIFGLHSQDKTEVPTESLPWAQILLATNAANSFTTPKEGDWVHGFFMDGQNGQIPVIMGIYNGIEGEAYEQPSETPKPPEQVIFKKQNEPLNARMSWEKIEGTMIDKMNKDLTSVCDVKAIVKIEMGKVKQATSTIIEEIKEAFRLFLKSLGFDPSGGEIRKAFQELKEIYAKIKKFIKMIRDELKLWKELILDAINCIKKIINFITSLPEKFRKFVADCIAKITGALKNGLSDLKEFIKGELGDNVDSVIAGVTVAFSKLEDITNKFQNANDKSLSAAAPLPGGGKLLEVITNTNANTINSANQTYETITQQFATLDEIAERTSMNSFSPNSPLTGP